MKLISYVHGGKPGFGIVKGQGIVALGARTGQPSLKDALDRMDSLRTHANDAPDLRLDEVTYAPPISKPDKILCVGLNYQKHMEETGQKRPSRPMIFTRFANTEVGNGQPMIVPRASIQLDYEGELAFVIGRKGRHISEADALAHVAGYSCFNDGSVRDWQFHTPQFTTGKNFIGTGGFGPWLVTPDEVPGIARATLATRLNGREVQHSSTDDMIFGVPALIAYISEFTELVPGDVVITGTPSGVGVARKPQLWLKPGDIVEVEIEGIGVLRNPVVAEE